MIQIRFFIGILALSFVLAAQGTALPQYIQQTLTFSIVGNYQTNIFYTNDVITNYVSQIKGKIINSPDIVKSIAIDLAGTNWNLTHKIGSVCYTNWTGAALI